MGFRILKKQKTSMVFLHLFWFVNPAYADIGHCNYQLHIKATGYAVKVCQTVEKPGRCGKLLQRKYDQSRARAVGKKGRGIKYIKGDCSREALVGICTLPDTQLYFYEGETEELVEGCDRMKGHWHVKRF